MTLVDGSSNSIVVVSKPLIVQTIPQTLLPVVWPITTWGYKTLPMATQQDLQASKCRNPPLNAKAPPGGKKPTKLLKAAKNNKKSAPACPNEVNPAGITGFFQNQFPVQQGPFTPLYFKGQQNSGLLQQYYPTGAAGK